MHYKLIVLGVALVLAVVFGFLFWGDFSFTQQEIANTPLDTNGQPAVVNKPDSDLSGSDSYDALERELGSTDLEIDSDNAEIEAEASGL